MPATQPTNIPKEFALRLQDLASECSGLDWILKRFEMSFDGQEAIAARTGFAQAAGKCQSFLIDASGMFEDFLAMDNWARSHRCDADLDEFVIPFALALESAQLTEVGRWVGDGIQIMQQKDGKFSKALMNARRVAMNAPFTSSEDDVEVPLIRPPFFHQGQFRHGFVHQQIFRDEVDRCMRSIRECSAHNASETAKWVNTIHKAKTDHPATGVVVVEQLSEQLCSNPVEGLETLREYIIGNHVPNGKECSERAARLFGHMIHRETDPQEIATHLQAIRLNERYFSRLFFDELTNALVQRCLYFNDNERGDIYDGGAQGPKQFAELFRQLELSEQDMAILAIRVTAGLTPGQQMDLTDRPIVEQFDHVMDCMQEDDYVTLNPQGNLRHAILAAAINVMPREKVFEIAQKRDASRMMIYKLTNRAEHLNGLENKKLADSVLGADLGL